MASRKSVALLFTSGTRLPHADGSETVVRSEADMAAWLHIFPEIQMIADITPVFVADESLLPIQTTWDRVIATIQRLHTSFDSFAIIHQDPDLTLTSSALTFGMPTIDDTIAIGSLGVRPDMVIPRRDESVLDPESYLCVQSNLINLIRASIMPLNTVAVVDDHRLFRANLVTRDPESNNIIPVSSDAPLGLIDYAVDFHHGRRDPRATQLFEQGFSRDVAVVTPEELVSGTLPGHPRAIIVDARMDILSKFDCRNILRHSPVAESVIVGPSSALLRLPSRRTLARVRLTYESLITKSMWLIARDITGKEFFRMLNKPLADELISTI